MHTLLNHQLSCNGFTVVDNIFSPDEIQKLEEEINKVDFSKQTVRKNAGLFAIRQFLKEVPQAFQIIFNNKLITLLCETFGEDFFIVKSIYFDKPETSNWFVAYHQDLTISVDKKIDLEGFGPWTIKQNQFAVQPPIDILRDNFTIRIHLDETTEDNGALKVIPGSHLKGICRDWSNEGEIICRVNKGGIMLMKPLLLHSSGRTKNNNRRRVIHLEFSRTPLPTGLNWSEFMDMPKNFVADQ